MSRLFQLKTSHQQKQSQDSNMVLLQWHLDPQIFCKIWLIRSHLQIYITIIVPKTELIYFYDGLFVIVK